MTVCFIMRRTLPSAALRRTVPKPSIITLDQIPTWAAEGARRLFDHPLSPKYPASTPINSRISFWMRGDSVRLQADAIVNAANSDLRPGGGICGAIHSAAGPKLAEECRKYRPCPTGKAVRTSGFRLPAKYVIHAVGPIGENAALLRSAYAETLKFIDGSNVKSIGLCCLSTGIYGYPIKPATHIALETVREFLENRRNLEKTERIVFVVFEPSDVIVYNEIIPTYFPIDLAGSPLELKDG
jgi:O-acetyl-ADP-ribose deacetylase (regulator of RNase III)